MALSPNENDVVNHPKHYCRENGMESIDEMVLVFGKEAVMNFCLCNVWKYRYRASDKNGEEDLKKSDWYMKKYKELKEEKENAAPTVTITNTPSYPITIPIKEIGDTCPEPWTIGDTPNMPPTLYPQVTWSNNTITDVKNN